jgi:hypothetical protein
MKKTSLLLAMGALLYGASGSYVFAGYDTMSDDEITQVLIKNGCIPDPNADGVAATDELDVPPEDEVIQGDVTAAKQDPPPSNIWVNSDNPVNMSEFCGFKPTGLNMANFPVSVNNNSSFAMFTAFNYPNSGIAKAKDWLLFEAGDTWNHRWCLVTDIAINDIVIDPLSRTGPGPEKYAFDIIYEPVHSGNFTIGSARGWGITQHASPKVAFKATYTRPVFVSDPFHPPFPPPAGNLLAIWNAAADNKDDIHDMYGTLKIDFEDPALGAVELPTLFSFRADTDCLPVQEVLLNSYDGTTLNFTVVGEGAVAITTTDGAVVQGPFVVGRGDGSANIVTQFTPQAGLCYVMADVDTGKVMTEEHCFQ